MRALALVLLLLINSFSLPLQAMNSHVMSANIPCDMQMMPGMMQGNLDENTDNLCHMDDTSTSNHLTAMSESNCDMCNYGDCSTASSLPFISTNLLIVASQDQTTTVLYFPAPLPEQHPESLYRPPLIG